MEEYFKWKIILDYVVPLGILGIIGIVCLIYIACQTIKYKEPNWCEFLMWESAKDSRYPMMLGYKYFRDEENDEEVQRRIKYQDGE